MSSTSVAVPATSGPQAPSRARKLRRRPGRPGLGSALVVPFIPHVWIGIGLLVAALQSLWFPLVWSDVDGHVSSKEQGHSKNGVTYTVNVAYDVDGAHGTEQLSVDADRFAQTNEGDVVKLHAARGLVSDTIAQETSRPYVPVILFLALFWNGIVGVFVYQLAFLPLSRWWLLRRGARVRGVVDHVDAPLHGKKNARATVRFHFDDVAGRVDASDKCLPRVFDASGVGVVGSEVTVYFHPRFPKLAVLGELAAWDVLDS